MMIHWVNIQRCVSAIGVASVGDETGFFTEKQDL